MALVRVNECIHGDLNWAWQLRQMAGRLWTAGLQEVHPLDVDVGLLFRVNVCCVCCSALPPAVDRSKLGWFLPRHTTDERRRLLDSCLNTRLLSSYVSSSSSLAGELSSNQV